ncbi:ALP1-like protein [Tanacetum coccineum]
MSDSIGGMSDLNDMDDIEMIMQQLKYEQEQEQASESPHRRNYIYCEREDAEERMMADYFGAYPKYPLVACANNDLTVLNNSPLFDDLFDDIAPVAPFEVNGVTFEKEYYLADGIYQKWSSFVKSFSVANSEKNALFKRKQESARKDIERAFGVLQGHVDDHRMLFMCLSDLGGQVNARGVPKASKMYSPYRTRLASFFARLIKMTKFAVKHSIMTREMLKLLFPLPVLLVWGGWGFEKDPALHLTARQEQTVRLLENNKAPFRRYPECFLCLMGLSPYYPFDENTYPAFERPDGTEMGLLDFIKTADPRKVQAVEVQKKKKNDRVKLLESTSHCFMSLVAPATGGSSSAPEVSAPAEVEPENVVSEDTYLDLTYSDGYMAGARARGVAATQSGLISRPNVVVRVPATRMSRLFTAALETSEGRLTAFNELPRPEILRDKLLFNVGAARQICLESEVRSRAEHELELKEKLKGKYDARGRLLEEKDLEILRLKSLLAEEAERAETAEVVRLRDQVSALTAEVSALKSTIAQKDTDISLLDSRATYLKSALDDSQAACAEAGSLITSLTSERDRLTSEVSTLHTAFQDFKEKVETQQEEQAQIKAFWVTPLGSCHGILVCRKRLGGWGLKSNGVTGTSFLRSGYNPEAARSSAILMLRYEGS